MRTKRARTPAAVRVAAVAILVLTAGWWVAQRVDRRANEHRLARIASEIAGREVGVRCPGLLARIGSEVDTTAGVVEVDANRRVADDTGLSQATCVELAALAESRRKAELACVERSSSCGEDAQRLAHAVDAVAHESYHLKGILSESRAECYSMQTTAWTATQLGATGAQARGLARLEWETNYPQMPEQYRTGACVDGGELDLRPQDPRWP